MLHNFALLVLRVNSSKVAVLSVRVRVSRYFDSLYSDNSYSEREPKLFISLFVITIG